MTSRGLGRDAVVFLAIVVVAAALRVPHLQNIPRFTDETGEVRDAYAIAYDGARPLTAGDAYRGPAWPYLLAATFRVAGKDPALPRQFTLVLSALAAGAAFLLARLYAGSLAGLLAGAWTASAFGLVTLGGHVAWSNNATPLWVLLAAWTLAMGLRDSAAGSGAGRLADAALALDRRGTILPRAGSDHGRRGEGSGGNGVLALSGVLWAVALQSHPSALAPLLGAAVWAAMRTRSRRPRLLVAGATFLLVMSPVIAYNVVHPMASLESATKQDQPIARERTPGALMGNASAMVAQIGRTAIAGAPREPEDPSPNSAVRVTDAVRPWAAAAAGILLCAALLVALVRGPRLVGAMGTASLVLLPLLNRAFAGFYDTRYVAFLVPLGYVALAAIAVESLRQTSEPPLRTAALDDPAAAVAAVRSGPALGGSSTGPWASAAGARRRAPRAVGGPRRWAVAVLAVLVVAYPVVATRAFYARETAAGRTNDATLRVVQRLVDTSGPDRHVFVDKALRSVQLGGGGNLTRAVDYLLLLQDVPHDVVDESELRWFLDNDRDTTFLVLAAPDTARALASFEGTAVVRQEPEWQLLTRTGDGAQAESP